MEESKTFTLAPGESEYFTFNNLNGEGFNYSLDSAGDYSVSVLYNNKKNVVQSVSMQNKLTSAVAKCEKGRYFIQIKNNSDSEANLQFKIAAASNINAGQANNLKIGHNGLFKINDVRENCRMNFKLTLSQNMTLALLNEDFDILEKESIISDMEFNTVLEKDKTYYVYIENDNNATSSATVNITYIPYEIIFGNNRRLTYGYDSMTYSLSLETDTWISIAAKNGVSVSVFSDEWSLINSQDGKYEIESKKTYFIVARNISDIVELDITHDSTDEYNGIIGDDLYTYIRFIPEVSDFYEVFGVAKYQWYDQNLKASNILVAGDLYYLKIYGASNSAYSISIERKTKYLRLLSERVVKSGIYGIEIEEDATYVISTTVRN
ncbi:MAG: hypothetical protein K2N32_03540, partial [Clostridia bacterium]|nr:hypothetical protein [Clostridia bacterium]